MELTTEFKTELADILEIPESDLESTKIFAEPDNIDSLQLLSIISIVDEYYETPLSGKDVASFKSVNDICEFIQRHKSQT